MQWLPKTLPLKGRPISNETQRVIAEAVSRLDRSVVEDPVAVLKDAQSLKRQGRPANSGPLKASRTDTPVAVKAGILQAMQEAEQNYSDEASFYRAFAKKFDRPLQQIKNMWSNRKRIVATQKKHRFSTQPKKFSSQKDVQKHSFEKRYKGLRLQGAGRRSSFESVRKDLKHWFNEQRCLGNQVLSNDLYERYMLFLHQHVLGLESKAEELTDPLAKGKTLALFGEGKKTLEKLENSAKYRQSLTTRLILYVGEKFEAASRHQALASRGRGALPSNLAVLRPSSLDCSSSSGT